MFQIHDKIKSNPDILKLLYYTDNTGDILNDEVKYPELTLEQAQDVVKNNIYTKKKIPLESSNIQAYICMAYGRKIYHTDRNHHFNGNTFNFYILCHNDYDTNNIIGSRVCEIERLIEEMFDYGEIGTTCKTRLNVSSDWEINGTSYIGRHIEMVFSDFKDVTKR